MAFGWGHNQPQFYALMNASLPPCLAGEKTPLPEAWGTIATPAIIQDQAGNPITCGGIRYRTDCNMYNASTNEWSKVGEMLESR